MKKLVTFRFDADLLIKARQLAQVENRTLTNFIETILKKTLNISEHNNDRLEIRGD